MVRCLRAVEDVRLKVWKLQRPRVVPHAWKVASVGRALGHSRHGATLSCKCEPPSAVLLLLREPLRIDALPDLGLMSQRRCVFGTFRPVKTTPAQISDHKKLGVLAPTCRLRISTAASLGLGINSRACRRDIKLKVPLALSLVSPRASACRAAQSLL